MRFNRRSHLFTIIGTRKDDADRVLKGVLGDENSVAARTVAFLEAYAVPYDIGWALDDYSKNRRLMRFFIRTNDAGAVLLRLKGEF